MEEWRKKVLLDSLRSTWNPIKGAAIFGIPLEELEKEDLLRAVNAATHGIIRPDYDIIPKYPID